MSDIVTRLRNWSIMPSASPASDLLEEAAYEIESIRADWPEQLKSLVEERDYWMRTAKAFDEHLATLRVAMMEHPTVRFGAAESRETVPQTAGPAPAADGTDWPTSGAGSACQVPQQKNSRGANHSAFPNSWIQTECPYVTGTVTRYCSLTPFTITDEEREAIENCIYASVRICDDWSDKQAATLRSLLERTT
jgi:hypothetical protein